MLIASTCLVPPALFLLPAAGCGSARTRAGWGDRAGNHDRRRQPAVCSSRLESEIEPAGRSERFSVRPDTWQPRVASNGAGAHRFGRRPCPMASNPVDPLVPAGAFAARRGLRILAGARYRWRCARKERRRGVAKTLLTRWRGVPPAALSTNHRRWAAPPSPGGQVEFDLR